jgi:hypothetical protein
MNCIQRDLDCVYPTKGDTRWRPLIANQAQTQISRESPIPSPSPRISTSTVTVDDLRFWHHYLVDARPGLPIGDEGTWSSQIPIFAHDVRQFDHHILSPNP